MTISEIVKNKSELIALKKSATKFSDNIDVSLPSFNKIALKSKVEKADNDGELNVSIVGNTYNWMDSHDDVHIKGIFTKTIKEQGNKIMHLHDHIHQLTAKVGKTQKVYEREVKWSDLGVDKDGNTTALLMDSKVLKGYNNIIYDQYKDGQIDQHSVGMQYVNIVLCVNDSEYKEEFTNWEKYAPLLGNLEKAEKQGYFYAVTEAKLKEISCVIAGSNELTPTLDTKDTEPSKDTQTKESEEAANRTSTLEDEEIKRRLLLTKNFK